MFANLSNHPVTEWSAPQIEAAIAMGFGDIVDLQSIMPMVDPETDTPAVGRMAEDIAREAITRGARGATVASDFVLTLALVDVLQRAGVRCFAATTRREATTEATAEGVKRLSVFRFVRWREYPTR